MKIVEKENLKKYIIKNNKNIKDIYNKNIEYMNYLNISYLDFLTYCYIHS